MDKELFKFLAFATLGTIALFIGGIFLAPPFIYYVNPWFHYWGVK